VNKDIGVMIAHGQQLVRAGLCAHVAASEGWHITGDTASGHEALAIAARSGTTVAIIGTQLAGITGIEVAAAIRRTHPQIGITLLSHTNDPALIARALQVGASAVLPPTATWTDIEPQLRAVAAGKYPINERILDDPDLAHAVFAQVRQGSEVGVFCPLSVQELRVLDLIANGRSTKEIAQHLAISEYTVKEYVANMLRKLGVQDRLQAVMAAIKHGWITVER